MAKEKKVNYTADQTATMIEIYTSAEDTDDARMAAMDEIQAFTGRTIASIRAKLGYEGVYISKAKPLPKGKSGVSKAELVAKIQDAEPAKPSGFFDSIEGANKAVLSYVLDLQIRANGFLPVSETETETHAETN